MESNTTECSNSRNETIGYHTSPLAHLRSFLLCKTAGVPVTIDWDFDNEYQLNIDMYEFTREPMRRRGRKKLQLSSKRRLQRLIDAGYGAVEIGEAIIEVDRAKSMRLESVRATGWNGTLENLTGVAKFTGGAIHKVGRRGSKIFMGSVRAAVEGLKIIKQLPRRKSITNPAC